MNEEFTLDAMFKDIRAGRVTVTPMPFGIIMFAPLQKMEPAAERGPGRLGTMTHSNPGSQPSAPISPGYQKAIERQRPTHLSVVR